MIGDDDEAAVDAVTLQIAVRRPESGTVVIALGWPEEKTDEELVEAARTLMPHVLAAGHATLSWGAQ